MYEVTALISSVPTKPVLVMPTKFPIVGYSFELLLLLLLSVVVLSTFVVGW